jgi:hypothetical protein
MRMTPNIPLKTLFLTTLSMEGLSVRVSLVSWTRKPSLPPQGKARQQPPFKRRSEPLWNQKPLLELMLKQWLMSQPKTNPRHKPRITSLVAKSPPRDLLARE